MYLTGEPGGRIRNSTSKSDFSSIGRLSLASDFYPLDERVETAVPSSASHPSDRNRISDTIPLIYTAHSLKVPPRPNFRYVPISALARGNSRFGEMPLPPAFVRLNRVRNQRPRCHLLRIEHQRAARAAGCHLSETILTQRAVRFRSA